MIGIIVGAISSLIIFSFFTKDQKAIKQNKEKKVQQQKMRQQQQKQKQQQIQKLKSDPIILAHQQKTKANFQQTFLTKIDPNDRKLINQYLQSNRKDGKTDEEIIRQAGNQATLLTVFMFAIVVFLVVALLAINGVELQQVKSTVLKVIGMVFPKIKTITTNQQTQL